MAEVQTIQPNSKRARSIGDTLDLDEIADLQKRHLVVVRPHPSLDLYIANYIKPSKDSLWTPTLELTRGLIYEPDGHIVARPFARMGDLREGEKMPSYDYTAYPKIDGSLAIGYPTPEGMRIASRGNFGGDVSEIGSKILQAVQYDFGKGVTPVFELVHPGRKHVVDYGDQTTLTLLGLLDTATGQELELPKPEDVDYPVVRSLGVVGIQQLLAQDDGNMEGFVLQLHNPQGDEFDRYKLKVPSYYLKDDIQDGWADYKIWKDLKRGNTERIDGLPVSAVRHDAETIVAKLNDKYDATVARLFKTPESLLSARELQIRRSINNRGLSESRDIQGVWDLIAPPRRISRKAL